MRRALCFLVIIFFLNGCAYMEKSWREGTERGERWSNNLFTPKESRPDYYTNPDSQGYQLSSIWVMCTQCNKIFSIGQNDLDNDSVVTCPACNHEEKAELVKKFYEEDTIRKEKERQEVIAKRGAERIKKARLVEEERIKNAEHGLVCIECERHFFLIGWQLELSDKAVCPYCEKEQNMQPALNRYVYDTQQQKQQQQQMYQQQQAYQQQQNQQAYQQLMQAYQQQLNAQRTQQAISDIFRTRAEYGRRKEQRFKDYADSFRQRGSSRFRPIYVSPGY